MKNMTNIATGTVTFLFTDIEGSTKLAQKFPESYSIALQRHHDIIRNAINKHNGQVFKIMGDAFCTAFKNSTDAIKAAHHIQKILLLEKMGVPIKVRIGIHKGKADWAGDDYSGYISLSRTNRIMAVANGGQVLISNEVYDDVKNNLPSEISLRDLGERRLKDLIRPEHLFQLIFIDAPSDFPPLNTLDARPNNLPVQLTSFVGRKKEMEKIKDFLLHAYFTWTRRNREDPVIIAGRSRPDR